MKTLLQILLFFLFISQTIIPQWYQQASGTGTFLKRVSFTDTNNGTAVGWGSVILRTTNGGANWIQQVSGSLLILVSAGVFNF